MGGLVLRTVCSQPQVPRYGAETRVRGPGRGRHRHNRRQNHAQTRGAVAGEGRLARSVGLGRCAVAPHAALEAAAAAAAASERGGDLRGRSPTSPPPPVTAVGGGRPDINSGGRGGSHITHLSPRQYLLVVGGRDAAPVTVTVAAAAAAAGKRRVYVLLFQFTMSFSGLGLDAARPHQAGAPSSLTSMPPPAGSCRPTLRLVAMTAAVVSPTCPP